MDLSCGVGATCTPLPLPPCGGGLGRGVTRRRRTRICMPVMSGKHAFLALLEQEGIEILFGNPGTTELPLQDALARDGSPRYVLALQEASVLAMADGYA